MNYKLIKSQVYKMVQLSNTEYSTIMTPQPLQIPKYEGWNFNSGNYLFTTDTK